MKYSLLTIASDGAAPSKRNRYRKTRAFSCTLLRCVAWPAFKPSPGKGSVVFRPIFLDYCGTESEHRAFTANLRMGKVASITDREAVELLRSEPYRYAPPQRCDAGVRQIVYLPEVFDLDCKEQRDDVWLCAMPPSSLLASVTVPELGSCRAALRLTNDRIAAEVEKVRLHNASVEANNSLYYSLTYEERRRRDINYMRILDAPSTLDLDDAAVRYWALMARELCVRLDARTRYPVPSAPEFRALLLQHFLMTGAAKTSKGNPLATLGKVRDEYRMPLEVRGPGGDAWPYKVDDVGYLPPIALHVTQDELGKALAQLASAYYARG